MRFRTSFLITLLFHLLILVVDKGAGFVVLWILRDAPDEQGGLQLIVNLPPILMAASNLGLASSIVYFMRRKAVTAETAGATTSMVALVWGFSVALLAFIFIKAWSVIDPKADLPAWSVLVPVLATSPFLLLISYRNSIQLVLGRIFGYNLVHLIPSVSYLPIFLLVYYGVTDRSHYHAGVWGRFLPAVVLAGALIWVLRAHVPVRPRFEAGFFRKALSYGWRANISSTVSYLNHRLDLYLVGIFFIASTSKEVKAEVAFYGVAVTLAELIWHFPEAMRDLMFSKVAGLTEDEARDFTPVVCRNSLWICLVTGTAIWFLHDTLMSLFLQDKWDLLWAPRVTPALAYLLPGTICFTIAKVLRADIMARGHMNAGIFFALLVFFTMLVGDVFVIPEGGAEGAAIVSTASYAAGALGTMLYYSRVTGIGVLQLLLIRRSDLVYYREMLARIRQKARGGDNGKE